MAPQTERTSGKTETDQYCLFTGYRFILINLSTIMLIIGGCAVSQRQALEHKIEARTTGRARRLVDLQQQATRQTILANRGHAYCQCWMYAKDSTGAGAGAGKGARVRVQLWIDIEQGTLSIKSVERESTTARSIAARIIAPFASLAQRQAQLAELNGNAIFVLCFILCCTVFYCFCAIKMMD